VSEDIRGLLLKCLSLKDLPRAGWVNRGVSNPESVAAHSWGVAFLALSLCPSSLDRGVVASIAIIHDLAEIIVGDITPTDGVSSADKSRLEGDASAKIFTQLGKYSLSGENGAKNAQYLHELWLDYDHSRTPEGRFVKACDKLDMALQAALYSSQQELDLDEFIESALSRLDDPILITLIGK
jgi:putative hydrolase of HD superfamily